MSKICPNCQEIFDDSQGFCSNCGSRLIDNVDVNPALNLGDANAISGGVNINQSKNITSHDTHYHTTTVHERPKSESELKLDATNQLRAKAEGIMAERGRIDSSAMGQLRPLALQLGIDDETFKLIIKEVRSYRNASSSGLSAANARYLQQAQQAVQTNDMDTLSNLHPRLEAMAAISQDDNVQYLYYLSLSILYPIKSMEVYERQTDENYWRSFWAIISYIRTGKYAEAAKVLALFDPMRYEKSEDDQNLLEAYFNIMKEDKDGAQEFLDEILGEPTEQVKPLLRAVEATLYEEEPESLEVRFYIERVMSKSDAFIKSKKGSETSEKSIQEKGTNQNDSEVIYNQACVASGVKRVILLQKAADAGHLDAMFDLSECYIDGNGVEKNLSLAIKWLSKAAESGHARSQAALGDIYISGREEIGQNYALSEKYFTMAAEQGNDYAQAGLALLFLFQEDYDKSMIWARKAAQMEQPLSFLVLGKIYDEGLGVEIDHIEGLKWYEKAADKGDSDAQNIVGNIYLNTDYIEHNPQKAFDNFHKAATQGHLDGMMNLGYCYQEGIGAEIDLVEAEKWIRKAAEGGLQDAIDILNTNPLYNKKLKVKKSALTENEAKAIYDAVDSNHDPSKIMELQELAETGDVWAMFYYARLYSLSESVNRNYELAVKYYTKAANSGNVKAMNNLGICYQDGTGVNKDYAEAAKWYRKAADAGNAWAMGNLGVCYENGKGVNQDYAEAARWYRKAADAGNAWAMGQIGIFYENGKGVNQNYAEAAKWYRKGADAGDSNAMFGLGNCYINGKGVIQDDNEGFNYFCMGAESGNLLSMTNVGWCYEFGRGTKINPTEAMIWYQKALDNGYQMDDWLSQRMEECKAKLPSDATVKFPKAWVTQGDNTYITIHFHFIVHNHKDRNLTFKFFTESLSPNSTINSNNTIFDDMLDYTAMCSYDNSEWKDYSYNLFQNIAKYNLQYGNGWKLKTTMSVYDDQGRLLGSSFIKYIVNHESRMLRGDKLIFVGY